MTIDNPSTARPRITRELLSLPRAVFWLGVVLFTLGWLIDFYPGAEQSWFTISAVLIIAGVFAPQRRYRIAVAVLLVLSILQIYEGHRRAVEYHKFLERHPEALKVWQVAR